MRPFFVRTFLCLSFLTGVFYLHSRHTDYIDNTAVNWQYVANAQGDIFLALDVFAPSGVTVAGIAFAGRDITGAWVLVNAPEWFQGREAFPALELFRDILSPYFPENPGRNILYSFGWTTYLYAWTDLQKSLPDEGGLKIRYRDRGTGNLNLARHVTGRKVLTDISQDDDGTALVRLNILCPRAEGVPPSDGAQELETVNLVPGKEPLTFLLADPGLPEYKIIMRDKGNAVTDRLTGFIRRHADRPVQVFAKEMDAPRQDSNRIMGSQAVALHGVILFVCFFLFVVFWGVGDRLSFWLRLDLERAGEQAVAAVFLGMMALTYLFLLLGMARQLRVPAVCGVTALLVFCVIDPRALWLQARCLVLAFWNEVRRRPWTGLAAVILGYVLYYNLTYCFLPAAFIDGSGDMENSILPNINDYILTAGFKPPLQNSTNGIVSQALDVLRAVMYLLTGEPGIYLLSFLYVFLLGAVVYMISARVFRIRYPEVYLTVMALLLLDFFTERVHLGKTHTGVLAWLMVALYAARYAWHPRNFILPALFFAFLTSQYIHFAPLFVVCLFYVFAVHARGDGDARIRISRQLFVSFAVFAVLAPLFNLKLILETGTFCPPGIAPAWLSGLFRHLNRHNAVYRYIDNDYIRFFYRVQHLSSAGIKGFGADFWQRLAEIRKLFPGLPLLIFLPALKRWTKEKNLFFILTGVLVLLIIYLFPATMRMKIFFLAPLLILLSAVIDSVFGRLRRLIPAGWGKARTFIPAAAAGLALVFMFLDFSGGTPVLRVPQIISGSLVMGTRDRRKDAADVFWGRETPYAYLRSVVTGKFMNPDIPRGADVYYDYNLLARPFVDKGDMVLVIPVRFHSRMRRMITARHALGSVIYQRNLPSVMADLKRWRIRYLSVIPVNYVDYNPYYSPVFDDPVFAKYFKLTFSYKGCNFYKIIYDGNNTAGEASPIDVRGRPFILMHGGIVSGREQIWGLDQETLDIFTFQDEGR